MLLFAVLPWVLLHLLVTAGAGTSLDATSLAIIGTLLAILATLRYVARPTQAFGPMTIVYAIAGIGYLEWLIQRSPLTLSYHGATIGLGYSDLLRLAVAVPALALVAGLLTTFEDAARPGERAALEFPPPAER